MASVTSSTSHGNPGAAKVCIACGQDCSNKPRSKDAQGRYTCKDCIDRVQNGIKSAKGPGSVVVKPAAALPADAAPKPAAKPAKKPAPKATDPGTEPDFMALFGSEPPKIGDPCEQCGDAMPPGGRICVRCGFDRELGKRMRTRVVSAPQEKGASKAGAAAGAIGSTGTNIVKLLLEPAVFAALGFFGLLALSLAARSDESLVPVLLGGLGLYGLIAWLSMIVTAFKDGNSGWGFCGIATPILPFAYFFVIYYLLMVAERKWLTMMWVGYFVLVLASWTVLAQLANR